MVHTREGLYYYAFCFVCRMKIWVSGLLMVTLFWRLRWLTVLVMNIVNLPLTSLQGGLDLLSLTLMQQDGHYPV